jgi:hypothetical protein
MTFTFLVFSSPPQAAVNGKVMVPVVALPAAMAPLPRRRLVRPRVRRGAGVLVSRHAEPPVPAVGWSAGDVEFVADLQGARGLTALMGCSPSCD